METTLLRVGRLATLAVLLGAAVAVAQDAKSEAKSEAKAKTTKLTPKQIAAALATRPIGPLAEKLAADITATYGEKALAEGVGPRFEDHTVVLAVQTSADSARVVRKDGKPGPELTRLGTTSLYVFAGDLPDGSAFEFQYAVGDKPTPIGKGYRIEHFSFGPDSFPQPGVPRGAVSKFSFKASKVFPGTERDVWVYVPAQYDGKAPAAVMVFQDGGGYQSVTGDHRVPVVFDNLIHKGEMPVTVGVFVNPGTVPVDGGKSRSNRSYEYDSLSDYYARFVIEELLPEVEKVAKVTLRTDPAGRAIGGISSGGICAFTVAWERPDSFAKVLSHVGSFTNIRGGDVYPGRIRKTEKKPIRVFLQEGRNDLDNVHGSWPIGNMQMEASLRFMGYDYRMVWGDGFHSGKHGGAILPDSLRWLWRDWQKELPTAAAAQPKSTPTPEPRKE